MAIQPEKALSLFGGLCNSLAEAVVRERAKWEPESPPLTVAMSTLGQVVASGMQIWSTTDLKAVFDLVESLLADGEESVKNAVSTGFLESLLSESSAGRLDFRKIAPFLGHKAIQYCREWDKFTGCATPGLETVR